MAIRESVVSSAVQFLQDPSVANSTVENRISFLRTKNLTQEEVDVALARASGSAPPPTAHYSSSQPPGPPQQHYQPYPQYAWQPPAHAPRRDWRDWFIMATVVSGVGYGLFSLGKRYVYPLVAPPTPERLEQDKKSIETQFDRAFALVEQLAKDTEALKEAEKERTERLDAALAGLETAMADLKSANRRREDDAQLIRDDVQSLKDAIPRAMTNQKDLTDNRLREINSELTSLKTLVSQRMSAGPGAAATGNYLRPTSGNAAGRPGTPSSGDKAAEGSAVAPTEASKSVGQNGLSRTSGLSNGNPGAKASIPAWQMAMANASAVPSAAAATTTSTDDAESASSGQGEASGSS